MFHIVLLVSGSKPVVGSSKKIILGDETRAIAIESLLLIPSGSSVTNVSLDSVSITSFNAYFTMLYSFSGETPLILA
jgi:hypothetical protein